MYRTSLIHAGLSSMNTKTMVLLLTSLFMCLCYPRSLYGLKNYDNHPDLAKAMEFDGETNGCDRKKADRSKAVYHYLRYLEDEENSFQRARVYCQLGAMYAVSFIKEKGEKRDFKKARGYYKKVLELEPERFGTPTIKARSMLIAFDNPIGFERVKAAMAFYEWLNSFDDDKIEKFYLPLIPTHKAKEGPEIVSEVNGKNQVQIIPMIGLKSLSESLKETTIGNGVFDARTMDVPMEGLTYILEHLPDNAPERKIVKRAISELANQIANEMLKDEFTVRTVNEQVVLYTIYRGPYNKIGQAIGKLFALAGQKGLIPLRGPVTYRYLNNPTLVSSEHWLTEIRIPVAEDALRLVGKLGEMTDVKKVPAIKMAVAIKPEGLADPGAIYKRLIIWIHQHNYTAIDGFREIFLTNMMSGDYSMMKSEIMVPIEKLADLTSTGCDN